MPRKSDQKTRIFALYQLLCAKSDEEHPLNSSEIIAQLNSMGYSCERKSVYADIEALNNYGIEVLLTSQPKKGYFLSSRVFEPSEISLLTDAVASANFITPKKTRQLISKLDGFLSDFQVKEHTHKAFISDRNKCENEEIFYNIDKIRRAISSGKKISFSYIRHNLENNHFINPTVKKMSVSPYALVWADDRYYLICNYEKYDNLMHLRLDRIKRCEICDENFRHFSLVSQYKDEFDIADYVEKSFNMFGGERAEVTFKCDISALEQMLDRFGKDIFVRSFDDSHFIFSSNVLISDGLVSWALSLGEKLEVLKPADLREKIKKSAEKILKGYK